MDEKIEKMLIRILYLMFVSVSFMVLLQNLNEPWPLLFLIGFFGLVFTIKKAAFDTAKDKSLASGICVFLEILAAFAMGLIDASSNATWLYFVLIADAASSMNLPAVSLCSALSFVLQSLNLYISHAERPLGDYIGTFAVNALIIFVFLAIIRIVRYQGEQKQKLSDTMSELKIKSRQLNNAYLKLRDTSEELEEMTILMERNRIAREIHDTVGHTLTTVLLELEASERLIPVDPGKAAEKLSLAKGQVRKGLSDIRTSVHTLQAGHEMLGLEKSLKLLIDETEKSGTIHIKSTIKELPPLTKDQEKMFYRALQEGLTNGIRHGQSTAFIFQLYCEDGFVRFFLSDNGKGAPGIEQGFGLSSMEERVKALGGTLHIQTSPNEGFTISISIPAYSGEEKEKGEE